MGMKWIRKMAMLGLALMMLTAVPARSQGLERLSDQQAAELIEAIEKEERSLPEGDSFRISVDPGDLSVSEGLDEDWQHILLMGTDTGNKTLNYGRTDAMLILSVNQKEKELKLTSLVRDMLVDIPGLHVQNRINTANRFGGPYLAIKTVNELMGLNITQYVSINFSGFSQVIDELGGVEIELSAGEAAILKVRKAEGPQLLNGEEALEYARIRKIDNNFGRNLRQRKVLDSLLHKVRGLDAGGILKLLPKFTGLVSTNLGTMEMLELSTFLLSTSEQPQMLSLPPDDAFHFYRTPQGASVITFDREATRKAFFDFIGE